MLSLRLILAVVVFLPFVLSTSLPFGPRSSASADYSPFDSSFRLVWSDEFNLTDGASPDPSTWNFETGGSGWGNEELEFYTARRNNSFIEGGRLVIQALEESYQGHNYTSARIDTSGKVEVLYGFIAARARIHMSDGFWPAFWLLGSQGDKIGWPRCGEMDIMEQVNGRGTGGQDDSLQFGTLHYNQYGLNATRVNHESTGSTISQKKGHFWGDESARSAPLHPTPSPLLPPLLDPPLLCADQRRSVCPAVGVSFHLYQALWTNESYTFMVDDLAYLTVDLTSDVKYSSFNNPQNPFFFIVNLAMGGLFPRRVPQEGFPARFELDWIRLYQQVDMGHVKTPKWAEEERIGEGEGQQSKSRELPARRTRVSNKHERVEA